MFSAFKRKLTALWRKIASRPSGGLVNRRHDFALMKKIQGKRRPTWKQIRFVHRVLSAPERIIFQTSLTVLSVSLIGLLFGFLSLFRTAVPAVGGEYVEGIVGSPRLVNPIFAAASEVDTSLSRLIYGSLMRYDGKQELQTDLADKVDISADKKTYTFSLNRNARWHDGEPLTARDVAFTFELIQDPKVGSPLLNSFQGVHVSVVDDYTIQFILSEPYPAFLSAMTTGILPEHVWSDIPRDQTRLAEANLKPVGSGPYQFKRFIKDSGGFLSRYELVRFPGYYHKPAYVKELAFQFYSDYEGDGGALGALRSQKIDGLSFVPATEREKLSRRQVQVVDLQVPEYSALFFNQSNNSALTDKDTRQALALAINKTKIVQETLKNEGSIIDGPILAGFPGYNAKIATLSSIDQANATLDKKWKRITADDYKKELVAASSTLPINPAQLFYRKAKDGKVLSLHVVTADTPEYHHTAELIAGYWQDIGVRTEVDYVTTKDITRAVLKDRSYDVLLFGVIIGGDPDQYLFWHSSQINYPGLNLARYANKKVDDILLKIRQTSDPDQLHKLYGDFQKNIIDDVPAIFLYSPTYTYALGGDVKGFAVERIAHPSDRFANVTDWYVKTTGQWK